MRVVLDRPPRLPLLLLEVGAVFRSAGEADVVGDHDRSRMEPSLPDDALEVWQVGGLVVIDEDEIDGSLAETVLSQKPIDRRSTVAECPDDHRHLVSDASVVQDPASDLRIRRKELDRADSGP